MISSYLLALAILSAAPAEEPPRVVLENEHLLVEFSAKNGSILRLLNKPTQLDLIKQAPQNGQPWALLLAPMTLTSDFEKFEIQSSKGNGYQAVALQWQTSYRITIKAEARLKAGSDELELRCAAENTGDHVILAFRYPAIQGIGMLSEDGVQDRLLHSTMMGALYSDPFHLFQSNTSSLLDRGLVVSRYPNGFHGSALQLMAYYAEGRGGFYIACQDGNCRDKDLNFFKSTDNQSLTCEIAHIQSDARAGKSLAVDYPIIIAPLTQGTWYEAAERYRPWAVQQKWCRRGTLSRRVAAGDACQWLLEKIGAVGMWWPFRDDIRADILRTRKLFDAPLLHLELWWSNQPSRETAQNEGDRFGPFYFPFMALKGEKTFEACKTDQIMPLAAPIPDWVALCPVQPEWRKVVCESAEDMAGTQLLRHHQIWVDENRTGCRADCLYYDIGPCAGVPSHCYDANHAHAPGAGREITDAYISLFEESHSRASRIRGAYVPVGTECVSEPYVGCLDLYYARNAGLTLDMEGSLYVRQLTWLPDGRMEIVPLFPYIYHEYGPVAVQGIYPVYPWNIPAGDDFFAWAEARTVLWGGLIVSFPVKADAAPSEDRARFLRQLVQARVSFARDYLVYGRMQHPPHFQCETFEIDHGLAEGGWLRKIRFPSTPPGLEALGLLPKPPATQKDSSGKLSVEEWVQGMLKIPGTPAKNPTLKVPVIVCQAYTLSDGRLGILLVNLHPKTEQSFQLAIDPVSYGLPRGRYALRETGTDIHRELGEFSDQEKVDISIKPYETILLEATPLVKAEK